MNKITYALTSGALIAMMTAAPALADDGNRNRHRFGFGKVVSALAHDQDNDDADHGIGARVHLLAQAQNNNKDNDDHDNDREKKHARVDATTTAQILADLGLSAGSVTAVNGSNFTINPVGPNSTTTVVTNANTKISVRGQATTSAALGVGSKVIVKGVASSTAPNTIEASFVLIIGKALGFLKNIFK